MNEVLPPKHRHIWVSVLLIIVAAGLAGGGVYYWQQRVVNNTKGSDRSQITSLNGKISSLSGQLSAANARVKTLSQPATPAAPAVSDQTAITNVVTADCEAQVGLTLAKMTPITITLPFATVLPTCITPGLTNYAGGGIDILKKVNGQWVIIDQPSNGISAATRQQYGIPDSIQ